MGNFSINGSYGPQNVVSEAETVEDLVAVVDLRTTVLTDGSTTLRGIPIESYTAALLVSSIGGAYALLSKIRSTASVLLGTELGSGTIIENGKLAVVSIETALDAQSDALKSLADAIDSGNLAAMGEALDGLWASGVPADIVARAREITMQLASEIAEERYEATGILGDGATGDNVLGDGFAYDYTQDLDNDDREIFTNEDGDTSPRPEPRPDNLGDDGDSSGNPIIIDLDGDGIEIETNGTVSFDVDGDGYLENTNWVGMDDGFLVIDLNSDGSRGGGDGVIDQSREIAFSAWGVEGDTDLQALNREFDDNNDGVLDAQDSVWSELYIWRDIDLDGFTDDGELRSLEDWGISQINLEYDNGLDFDDISDDRSIGNNTLLGSASYTRNGAVIAGGVGDVSLAYDSVGSRRIETSLGYSIELETGLTYRFAELGLDTAQNVDLTASWLDGAVGDDRANTLSASGSSLSVVIAGGAGDDTIVGGLMDDMLSGDGGGDELYGGGGNDIVYFDEDDTIVSGGSGHDIAVYASTEAVSFNLHDNQFESAYGGEGNDTLSAFGADYSVSISGSDGNDTITGGEAGDTLSGDDGNDTVNAGSGDDTVIGGDGNDTLRGEAGDDFLLGSSGDDVLEGGTGGDLLYGGDGVDILWGGQGDDTLNGGDGNDNLYGEDGDDRLIGGDGNDLIGGAEGDDVLLGGDGNDSLYDGSGDDYVDGGAGNDTFYDRAGDDYLHGGEGNDKFYLETYSGNNIVQGGKGTDTLVLNGTADLWAWEYVEDGAFGVGQYLFRSGDTYIQVQDVENVEFTGSGSKLLWSHSTDQTSDEFVMAYVASNASLISSIGADIQDARAHYLNYGKGEGREVTFNALQYLADQPDVYNANGLDLRLAAVHFINHGYGEGRSAGTFDAEQYLRNYADLRAAFGTDLSAATRHYIVSGRSAGRSDDVLPSSLSETDWNTWIGGNSGLSSTITLANVDANTENEDTFYLASYMAETDPHETIYGWEGASNDIDGGSGNDTISSDNYAGSEYNLGGTGTTGMADTVSGGDGSDTISTGAGDDIASGDSGADVVLGGFGDDVLSGQSGNDFLRGDEGNDTLWGYSGSDILEGGEGNDYLHGGMGSDVLRGGAGNDTLIGSWGADSLYGGDDDDVLDGGDGADLLYGNAGDDEINSGGGADKAAGGDGIDTIYGGLDDDVLAGENGNDFLYGEAGNDHLLGGLGNDRAEGGAGHDYIQGEEGNDFLAGGENNDILSGGAGNDQIYGGNENDVLNGGLGADNLNGGAGVDTVSYADATEGVYFQLNNSLTANFTGEAIGDVFTDIENAYGTSFNDTIFGTAASNVLWGDDGADTITGWAGNDDLFGGEGNDYLLGGYGIDRLDGGEGMDFLLGGQGADQLIGGNGIDRAQYGTATTGLFVDLLYSANNTGDAEGDTFYSIENLYGSAFDDELRGDNLANSIWGDLGNDLIIGRGGDDILYGGDGNDHFYGGTGSDALIGGNGFDRAIYSSSVEDDLIVDLQYTENNTVHALGDTFDSIEQLEGGDGNDSLRGDASNNSIIGGAGNDTLNGRDGTDGLWGGDGNDQLNGGLGADALYGGDGIDRATYYSDSTEILVVDLQYTGNNTASATGDTYDSIEQLSGGDGDDSLRGDEFDNLIIGGNGNDGLSGRLGNDSLWGGGGGDQFHFFAGDGHDTVLDFEDNIDALVIRNYGFTNATQALSFASQDGGDVVFAFNDGSTFTVVDTTVSALENDVLIV